MTQPLFHYFLNSLWQLPLLALCTWLALRIARPAPRARYALWIATLLLALLLPLRGISLASSQITLGSSSLDITGPLPPLHVSHTFLPSFTITVSPRICNLLATLYLALTLLCALRLLVAYLAIRRLIAASTPWQAATSPQLPPGCSVLTLPPTHTAPLVAGILHPVILLPASLHQASPQQLATVFAHEAAHILRRDLLVNAALRVLTLPIAYHPVAACLHSQVRRARELLVDALAASTLASPAAYASSLLALSTRLVHAGTPLTAGLFEHAFQHNPSQRILEERIMHLIAPSPAPRSIVRAARMAAAAALLIAAATTASLFHLTPAVLAAQQPAETVPQATPPAMVPPAASPAPIPPSDVPQSSSVDLPTPATHPRQFTMASPRIQAVPPISNPIDPATQARINQLSAEIAKSAVNSPGFKKSMEELRRQLESPEFKQHIRDLTQQAQRARNAGPSAEDIRKMTADIQRRVNSPEFRQQLAQIRIDTAAIQKQVAEATAQSAPAISAAGQDSSSQNAPVRISGGMMAGQRESGKNPTYPPDAKAAKISGTVVLHAIIAKDGTIESLQTVSGPPELQQAAWDAVKTWVYKPYLLNGEPTAVETTITVNFNLAP